ncbi:MAG TPA: helix-turn-helix domain-containing protein [Candidatus Binataceae bacterium]|nr:helix-turn-helix domain-containing protein [Candidatus Binataceae bacterium]
MTNDDRLLTLKQVGAYLGVGRSWLIDHIKRGDLVAFRVGGVWRVSRFELRRFLMSNRSDRQRDRKAQEANPST